MLLRPPYTTLLNSPPRDAAASIFASYGTPGILLGDLNPARLTASGLSPSYLESTGLTAADSSGQTLGLLLERSGGAAIGAQIVSNPGGPYENTTGYSAVNATLSVVGGRLRVTKTNVNGQARISATVVVGGLYRVRARLADRVDTFISTQVQVGTAAGGAQYLALNSNIGPTSADLTGYFVATGTTAYFQLYSAASTGYEEWEYLYLEPIAGNHLYQSTAADEPTLVQESGIWRLRGDGARKNFLTPLVPAASMTMMVACEFNAVSDVPMGAHDGTSGFIPQLDATGKLSATVGTTSNSTIVGGADIRDIPGVVILRATGAATKLAWKPLSGALTVLYDSTFTGSIPTTVPFRVGSRNVSGTAGLFLDGDIYRVLAQQSAYTDAEISAIASQWSRELGGTG